MSGDRRSVFLLLALGTFSVAIFRILGFGYLPPDDVLRHAAFATTHRSWDQILLGRPEALFDQSPGWHALLRLVHKTTGWGPEALAIGSIAGCLLLFFAAGLLWVRRWEAWVLALAVLFLLDGALIQRLALGRPFVLTTTLALCLLGSIKSPGLHPWWSRLHLGWLLAGVLATWIHGSWYLLFLLPTAVLLAGRWREALRLGTALLAGCTIGAVLTGHPIQFLWGQLAHLAGALGQPSAPRALAMEFLPGQQPVLPLLLMGLVGLWGRGRPAARGIQADATFLLAVAAWIAGYFWVWRLYLDWAFPALALWLAWKTDDALEAAPPVGWGRAQLTALAAVLFLAVTGADLSKRWSIDGSRAGLDPRRPAERALLPEPGGVLYSTSMYVFYATFFHNPEGPWKYVLGYEPGLMTAEDALVYQSHFRNQDPARSLAPWVTRMNSRDRMVLEGQGGQPPRIPALAWTYVEPNKWVGRKLAAAGSFPASQPAGPSLR